MSLYQLSLLQMTAGLRRGDFSSRELVSAHLERIDSLEPRLDTLITPTPALALAQAEAADARLAKCRKDGLAPPALLGIPIGIKDVLCLAGVRCTSGSRILENFIPVYTATAVERLLAEGCVVLGKTNTAEFAMGSSTENSAYGTTHHPWDLARVPGGSSGGSAAMVAACLAPAALGTDTGGSVRQPASFCGVTGIKPTYGRVSRYGLVAYGSSLDSVGVLARSAADAAVIFGHMAGCDPCDATSIDLPVENIDLSLPPDQVFAGMRIGVPEEYFRLAGGSEGIQAEVETAVRQAIEGMERRGARVVPVSLPHTNYAVPVYYLIAPAEASANLARFDGVRYGPRSEHVEAMWDVFYQTRGERFGPEVKRRIMLGTYALSAGYYDAYYGQAQKVRTLIKNDFENAFRQVDVIAAPVAPTTAFRVGEHSDNPLAMYFEDIFTLPANLAGIPALAFPCGFDSLGLPVGIQLMGPHFQEARLFRIAHAYQQDTDWHTRSPKL